MTWIRKNKWWLAGGLAVIVLLAAAFFAGGSLSGEKPAADDAPDQSAQTDGTADDAAETQVQADIPAAKEDGGKQGNASPEENDAAENSAESSADQKPAQTGSSGETGNGEKAPESSDPQQGSAQEKPDVQPEPDPEPQPDPVPEPEPEPRTCTISVSCATLLNNLDKISSGAQSLVPGDGWVLAPVEVELQDGETIFDVLQRVLREKGIHMEYSNSPIYSSAYIEGIANIYEFDAGELSGWMYSVNGVYPQYGCSRTAVEDGDVICWRYTCDLGADIGGSNFS